MSADAVNGWSPRPEDRIIEVAPPDSSCFEFFRRQDCSKYLALVAHDADAVRLVDAGIDGERVAVMESSDDVRRNNADILIVHGEFGKLLWYRQLGLAEHILIPVGSPAEREALLVSRLHRRRTFQVEIAGRLFRVLVNAEIHDTGARHFLPHIIGIEGLPRVLRERGVEYVVLRWFDQLPHRDPGEDLDVLVRDAHLNAMIEVLDDEPGTIPVDVYSETGLPGSDFKSMAYYPPRLSSSVLTSAVELSSGYRAPAPADHFHSLTYHALYHKGAACGVPTASSTAADIEPEHDYLDFLTALAAENGYEGEVTMEALDSELSVVGWQPPRDMLAKLSHENEWVAERFFSDVEIAAEPPLLTVFVMRQRASSDSDLALAESVLQEHGFEILVVQKLSADAAERSAAEIRGGNWGQGPYALSGGTPSAVVVAMHVRPRVPSISQRRDHPDLANACTLDAKLDFRGRMMEGLGEDEMFNPMHSSDSDADAWHYLELAAPECVAEVRAKVDARRDDAGWEDQANTPTTAARDFLLLTKLSTRSRLGSARRHVEGRLGDVGRSLIDKRVQSVGSRGSE